MSIKRVYTTVYYVDDWEQSVAFYKDTLGLRPLYVERGWAEFQVGAAGRIALHAKSGHHHGKAVAHVSLEVKDIDATLATLTSRGARIVEAVRREPFGAVAAVEDPSGNVIGLFEAAAEEG
jgi:predicted enzyme related to lactoylglutathione lyase